MDTAPTLAVLAKSPIRHLRILVIYPQDDTNVHYSISDEHWYAGGGAVSSIVALSWARLIYHLLLEPSPLTY